VCSLCGKTWGLRVYLRHHSVECTVCGCIYPLDLLPFRRPAPPRSVRKSAESTPLGGDREEWTAWLMRRDAAHARQVVARKDRFVTKPKSGAAACEIAVDRKTKKPERR
jgi:hypothetical protein